MSTETRRPPGAPPGRLDPRRRGRPPRPRPLRRAGRPHLVLDRGAGPHHRRGPVGHRQRRADHRAQRQLDRLPPRAVHPAHRRDRRRAPHPLLLDGERRRRPDLPARHQGPSRGPGQPVPPRPRRTPGMVVGLTPAAGTFVPPRRAPRAHPADQRRQRHHAGAVHAADARAPRATTARSRFLHYATEPEARPVRRPSSDASTASTTTSRSSPRFTTTAGGDLTGLFRREPPRRGRARLARRRGLRLRPGAAHGRRPCPLRRRRAAPTGSTGGLRPADVRRRGRGGGRRRAVVRSASATSDLVVDNNGRPLLEQAEDAGLDPDHGCRMGICHTCTRR